MRFMAFAIVGILCLAMAQAPAPDPAQSKSIKTFLFCLNEALMANTDPVNISHSISACIPPRGCYMTGTSSEKSAQPACQLTIPGVPAPKVLNFPRVLLECPGTNADRRFRPSYSLCPFDAERIEIGEDMTRVDTSKKGDGKMIMADVPFPNDIFHMIDPNAVFSLRPNTKSCNDCHTDKNPNSPDRTLALSGARSAWESDEQKKMVLFTNEPGRAPGGNPQDLATVCRNISDNKAAILAEAKSKKPNAGVTEKTIDVIEAVCTNLTRIRPN